MNDTGGSSNLFEMLLLSGSEIEHFIGVLDQHSTLGLRLGNIKTASEYSHFSLLYALDGT